ncbi:hypothetical protein AAE478_001036 [Parahypoxylon ruwenzoriense]
MRVSAIVFAGLVAVALAAPVEVPPNLVASFQAYPDPPAKYKEGKRQYKLAKLRLSGGGGADDVEKRQYGTNALRLSEGEDTEYRINASRLSEGEDGVVEERQYRPTYEIHAALEGEEAE